MQRQTGPPAWTDERYAFDAASYSSHRLWTARACYREIRS